MKKLLLAIFLVGSMTLQAQLPTDFDGLALWLRADSAMDIVAGKVATWYDLSDNNRNLTQSVSNFRPLLLEDQLYGHRTVSFNGVNQRMVFDELSEVRTVFWVLKEDDAAVGVRPLLGHSINFPFFRGENQELWHPNFADEAVRDGATRVGFQSIDGDMEALPGGYQIVSLVTTAEVMADQLGQDRNTNNFWFGEVAELMVYVGELSETDVEFLENYLADYYVGEIDLLPEEVLTENLCPVTLAVADGFEVLQWSSGEVTQSIEVESPGEYSVLVTDAFGRQFTDVVTVSFPGNTLAPEPTVLCAGDSVQWDLELDGSGFAVLWSDGSEGFAPYFSDSGSYSAVVTDLEGCVLTTAPFEILLDDFTTWTPLGEDRDLCSGNYLSIADEEFELASITWNDGSDGLSLPIETEGNYWVDLVNDNGCFVSDTVAINIIGQAPELVILPPPVICQGVTNDFGGSVSADGLITSWQWEFPDGSFDEGQQVQWVPADFGDLELTLTVTVDTGCSATAITEMSIYPQPEAVIEYGLPCALEALVFNAEVAIAEGFVSSIQWEFQEEIVGGAVVSFTPQLAGFEPLYFEAISNAGCPLTIEQLINVQASPQINFPTFEACLGSLINFSADISQEAGDIVGYSWNFGDISSSNVPTPQHLYTQAGIFDVMLYVSAENGCHALATTTADVVPLPNADFEVSNACLLQEYQVLESSTSAAEIIEWIWDVENQGTLNGENISLIFEETGFHEVSLLVSTALGCSDEITKQIPVFDVPIAEFTFDPLIGLPPLEVQFFNESSGAQSFWWDLGNGEYAEEVSPFVTYFEEGDQVVNLTATNAYGCSSSSSAIIQVAEPYEDLRLEGLYVEQTEEGDQLTALIFNLGNYTIHHVALNVRAGSGDIVTEIIDVSLPPGAVMQHELAVALSPHPAEDPFYCAEVLHAEPLSFERTPENNVRCVGASFEFYLSDPFPNPVSEGGELHLRAVLPEADKVTVKFIDQGGKLVFQTEELSLHQGYNEILVEITGVGTGQYTLQWEGEFMQECRQVFVTK